MRRLLVTTLAAALLLCGQPDLAAKLDRIPAAFQTERGFMGTVLVAKGGTVLLDKGYGSANLEWDLPNTPETRFRLGSITKQFTAALVLQLVEQNKLSLDDSIHKHFPDLPESWKPITVHHLLNHTSGIVSYTGLPDFRKPSMRRVPLTPMEIVLLSKDKPLEFTPGEKMQYNNTGYVLLGALIEKVTGQKYDAVLKTQIVHPLGLTQTDYDWTRPILPKRAAGYEFNPATKSYQNADFLDMSLPHAAGSLYSTARDLYKWERALTAGKVLNPDSLKKTFTPGKSDYGYGWVINSKHNGRTRIGHGGGINGFSTMIFRYPNDDAVIVVLSNVENGNSSAVANNLENVLFGRDVVLPWERTSITLDPKILDRYTGVYKMGRLDITITAENGKLYLQATGQPRNELFAESETRFFLKVVDALIDIDPAANELTLRQGGNELRGKRAQP